MTVEKQFIYCILLRKNETKGTVVVKVGQTTRSCEERRKDYITSNPNPEIKGCWEIPKDMILSNVEKVIHHYFELLSINRKREVFIMTSEKMFAVLSNLDSFFSVVSNRPVRKGTIETDEIFKDIISDENLKQLTFEKARKLLFEYETDKQRRSNPFDLTLDRDKGMSDRPEYEIDFAVKICNVLLGKVIFRKSDKMALFKSYWLYEDKYNKKDLPFTRKIFDDIVNSSKIIEKCIRKNRKEWRQKYV